MTAHTWLALLAVGVLVAIAILLDRWDVSEDFTVRERAEWLSQRDRAAHAGET